MQWAAPVTVRRWRGDSTACSSRDPAALQKRTSSTLKKPSEQRQSRHGQGVDPYPHQHWRHQANGHFHFIAHRVYDVVVTLHVDDGDREDGGANQAHAEKEVALAQGLPKEGSAWEHAEGHQHQGRQQVHHAQVEHKGKLVKLWGLGDDRHDSRIAHHSQQIHEQHGQQG